MKIKTRLSIITLLVFAFISLKSQNANNNIKNRPSEHLSFCGADGDYVKKMNDAFAFYKKNKFVKPEIAAPYSFMPLTTFPSSLVVTCGSFKLHYEDDFIAATTSTVDGFADPVLGADRKATLCAVLSYIESVIDIPTTIDIFISQSFSGAGNPYTGTGGFLAFAGPQNPTGFAGTPGIYNGYFSDHVTSGVDPDINEYDMSMTVNFHQFFDSNTSSYVAINYYNDYTNTSANCAYDLFTVLLHEITHGMGIISFVSEDNTSTHQAYNGNNSVIYNNAFSGFDNTFLYKGDIIAGTFTKVVTAGPQIDPLINSVTNPLRSNDIWLNNTTAPNNQPIYSGNILNQTTTFVWPMTSGSFMSHFAYDFGSFTGRSQYSPGYQPNYVMGAFIEKEEFKREWTFPEIRTLCTLGYSLNPTFSVTTSLNGIDQNGILIFNNTPAYRTNPATNVTEFDFNGNFSENNTPDFNLTNDNSPSFPNTSVLTINISSLPNINDNQGDVISVMPNSLFGIRGVSNGGNNHNLLSLNGSGTSITYTPVPGYRGIAQFGFYLWDGHERGAFKIITIAVQQGTYTPIAGQELAVNGNFEDGTEVRQRLGPNTNKPYTGYYSGFEGEYFSGTHFTGGHPYPFISNWWVPYGAGGMILDSWRKCYTPSTVKGEFGSSTNSSDNPGTSLINPLPDNSFPNNDRYAMLFYANNPFFFNLSDNLQFNNFYQIEFDAAFSSGTGTTNGNPFMFTFNAISNPIPNPGTVTYYQTENIPGNVGVVNSLPSDMNWQHVVYTFQYCSSTPANHISIWSSLNRTSIDNFSIRQVTNPPAFSSVNAFATPTLICSGATTSLSAAPDNNSCIITYTWNPGNIIGQTAAVSPTTSTVYTVTATDGITTATAAISVSVAPLPTISVSASSTTICAGQSVTLTASGGNSYYWNPLAVNGTTVVVSPTVTTTYFLTGWDVNSCSSNTFITINIGGSAISVTPLSSTICIGQTTTLTASGATTYTWDNGSNSASIAVSPTASITYTVDGTDASGCIGTTTANVIVASLPSVSVTASSLTLCTGQSATLSAFGASTYTWNTGSSSSIIVVTPTINTSYTVTGFNTSGCTDTEIISITVNNSPTVSLSASSSSVCAGNSATLTASGALNYTWTPGASTLNPLVITPSITTVYSVIGSNSNGCTSSATITMTVRPNPTVTALATLTNICSGQTTMIYASGASSFTWNPGGLTGSVHTVTPGITTTYSASGVNVYGCVGTNTITVNVNSGLPLNISSTNSAICVGQQATLTASGATNYTWSAGSSTINPIVVSPSVTTIYSVIGSSVSACNGSVQFTLVVNPNPTISISSSTNTVCENNPVVLTGSGASTYTWSPGSSTLNPITFTPSSSSIYTLTGVDVNGCSATSQYTVNVNPTPTLVINSSTNTICSGESTTLTVSGANNYTWTPSALTSSVIVVSPISSTNYTIDGSDLNGCIANGTIGITVNSTPTINISSSSFSICSGQNTTLSAAGAGTYTWQPGSMSSSTINVSPLINTNYTVTGTSLLGCTSSETVNVTVNPNPTITISASSTTVCSITSSTLSATGASSYTWLPGSIINSSISVSPSVTTTYTVIGTNSFGCSSSNTISITNVPCTCTTCTAVGSSGIITSTTIVGGVYCFNTPTITISGNVTFINCEVKMSPGVTVIVPAGSSLTIRSSHVYSCLDMWQGIIVQNGGKLNVRSSLFEDAIVGVDITNNTSTTNVLTITNSTFNRNRTSVIIKNYTQTIPSYPFTISNSLFTCRDLTFTPNSMVWPLTPAITATTSSNPGYPLTNIHVDNALYSQITTNAFLKAPYFGLKSDAGIILDNVGVTLNPQTTSPTYYQFSIGGLMDRNIIDNCLASVRLINSNFSSVNTVYQNTGKGIGITANSDQYHNCRLEVIPSNTTTGLANNNFVDCGVGIGTFNYFEHNISHCDFRTSQVNMAPTYSNRIGVYINTNRYRVCNVSRNTLYNLETGIVMNAFYGPYNITGIPVPSGQYAGKVNIDRNTIRPQLISFPMTTQYFANGIVLQNVSGSNLQFANSITPIISASNNTITAVYRGILYSNWIKENILVNSNNNNIVFDPFTTNPIQYGIKVDKCWAASYKANSVKTNTITGYGSFNPNAYGIITNISNDIVETCNRVSAITNGIEFDGLNSNVTFNNNFMSTCKNGYVLNNTGVIGTQGSNTNPSDNQWTGLWPVSNYKTATINSTAQNSKFYIRTSLPASPYNPNNSSYTNLTYAIDNYTLTGLPPTLLVSTSPVFSLGCPIFITATISLPGMIPLYEQIADDKFAYFNNISETKYINKNELYRILKDDPGLMSNSQILQNFYNNNLNSNYNLIDVIEREITSGNYASASSKLAFFVPQNNIENNYKDFFSFFINYQLKNSISKGDNIKLYQLAQKCPYTDGMVIYQARSLYNIINNTFVSFEGNCGNNSAREITIESNEQNKSYTAFDAVIFPNPNHGKVNITFENYNFSSIEITVIDVSGRIIFKDSLNTSNSFATFDLDVKDGVYFVKMLNQETKEELIKKLVIEK